MSLAHGRSVVPRGVGNVSHIESSNPKRTVILGVAASDVHVVANFFIAHLLGTNGFEVVNLGACTSIAEFAAAYHAHPEAEAVLIGSVNGNACEDLRELPSARRRGLLDLSVIVGGNTAINAPTRLSAAQRLRALGVDWVLDDLRELVPLLERLCLESAHRM
jgi:methylaspartate mutase sigma subunit